MVGSMVVARTVGKAVAKVWMLGELLLGLLVVGRVDCWDRILADDLVDQRDEM